MEEKYPKLNMSVNKFIKNVETTTQTPLYKLSPQQAREFLHDIQRNGYESISANIEDISVPFENTDISVRIVRPGTDKANDILPAILYVHGGGWVMGDKTTHDMLIRTLANCTGCAVFFPEYSPAPETQYPYQLNQIYTVLKYMSENAVNLRINPEKIMIAGDSAGGNMAAAAALKAKDENGPKILYQILLYPVTSAEMNTKSYKKYKKGPWLTKKSMQWFWDAYAPDKAVRKNKYVSPLSASTDELKGLPPALIITDENDVLRDEGEQYARKLDKAGVKVTSIRINGTHHDFLMLNSLYYTTPTLSAFTTICKQIRDALIQYS